MMRTALLAVATWTLLVVAGVHGFDEETELTYDAFHLLDVDDDVRTELENSVNGARDMLRQLLHMENAIVFPQEYHSKIDREIAGVQSRLHSVCSTVQRVYDDRSRAADELREKLKVNQQLALQPGRSADKFKQLAQENAQALHLIEESFKKSVTGKQACDRLTTLLEKIDFRHAALEAKVGEHEEL